MDCGGLRGEAAGDSRLGGRGLWCHQCVGQRADGRCGLQTIITSLLNSTLMAREYLWLLDAQTQIPPILTQQHPCNVGIQHQDDIEYD